MNLEIFKYPDPSGRMSRESYLSKNYNEEYNYIIDYCNIYKIIEIPFKEKVYLCINNLIKVPICKNVHCEKRVNFKNLKIGYFEYCSNKCVSSDENIIKLKEVNSLKKYGTKSPTQSNEVKEKAKKTNYDRYGEISAMCLKKTQEKSKKTLLINYGVDNPVKNKELLKKRIESFKLSNFKENYKKTSIEKYGTKHPWMNKIVHIKTIESNRINKNIFTRKLIEDKLENYKNHKLIEIDYKPTVKIIKIECPNKHIFEISRSSLYERNMNNSEICTICNPICKGISGMEISMVNFIKENYQNNIIENSRKIIYPYEIDVYLPDIKLAIEFNGLYWHSSLNKLENYHKIKYDMCIANNINLITIWEDDWIFKQEIVKSFILNKLGRTKNKIYARKCIIREVKYSDSKLFLDNNHLQGDCKSSIRIGLFYDNEMVSLMTFSKLRLPLQKQERNRNKYKYYELTRFCNKIHTNVVGGASRLIKFFIEKYNPIQIETYSDNLISNGNLYSLIGFKYSHTSKPGYWYVIDGNRQHRFNWRKQKLVKIGYDINKTEEEIMSSLGHYRIYNAGNKKWIYNIEKQDL